MRSHVAPLAIATLRWMSLAIAAIGLCAMPPTLWAKDLLPSIRSREKPTVPPRAADLPSDDELEAAGAVIGEIRFDTRNIFDVDKPEEDALLFGLANRLHIRTREEVIAQQLLFKSGERYSRRILEESERLLRTQRYFYDARIRPVGYRDGRVDVEVFTRDVWTLNPGISYSRRGGVSTEGVSIEELNLFGWGKFLSFSTKSDVDRRSKSIDYQDPQLAGTRWTLAAAFADNSDGRRRALAVQHPFYSADTRWSAGVNVLDDRRTQPVYDLGNTVSEYQKKQRGATLFGGWSPGLQEKWTTHWTAGITHDENEFAALATQAVGATTFVPDNRKLVYPWLAYALLEDDFRTIINLDQIGRAEDLAIGLRVNAQIGYAATRFGSDRGALIANGSIARAWLLSDDHIIDARAGLSARLERSNAQNALFNVATRYYWRQSPSRLFFAAFQADATHRLDADQQLLLGGDNGLRGYPLRYQGGTSRWLFTAEQRIFSDWYPFRLFRVGAAAFVDVGRTAGSNPRGSPSLGVLGDAGFGLRLGNSRSGLGNVLHLDVALPLNAKGDIKQVQFLVETKRSF